MPRRDAPIVHEAPPLCIQCGYNLTGLASSRCPECGWVIDWALAWTNEEERRIGTPAHSAHCWRHVWAMPATVGLLLFRPIQFARRLRCDESFLPAAAVAVAACLVAIGGTCLTQGADWDDAEWLWVYGSAITVCILTNSLVFATFARRRPPALRWRQRLRLSVLLGLYSTCFVAAWPFMVRPPCLLDPANAEFLWPLDDLAANLPKLVSDPAFLGRTILFYWWAAVVFAFAIVRTRPRWLGLVFFVAPAVSNLAATVIGARVYFSFW